MQNPNVKYLKTPQGDIAVFSLEHNRLWCRRQTADGRYTPFCIAEGVSAFSLCQYESYTYLLYPTTDGRLILSASSDLMQWEPRPLWQAGDKRWQNTYCFMAPQKDAFHLFYGVSNPKAAITFWNTPCSRKDSGSRHIKSTIFCLCREHLFWDAG